LDPRLHNLKDRAQAAQVIRKAYENGETLTGLFYIDEAQACFSEQCNLPKIALSQLAENQLRPSTESFDLLMSGFR
jgi:hypothetical protein